MFTNHFVKFKSFYLFFIAKDIRNSVLTRGFLITIKKTRLPSPFIFCPMNFYLYLYLYFISFIIFYYLLFYFFLLSLSLIYRLYILFYPRKFNFLLFLNTYPLGSLFLLLQVLILLAFLESLLSLLPIHRIL